MRINIEKEFACCVRAMGGQVIDEVLFGNSAKPLNADFWFPEYQVISEFKCLTKNLASQPEFNRRISELLDSWIRQGLVPKPNKARVTFNIQDLPITCAKEFLDPIKRRLEVNTFKKANSQIKALKKHLDCPNAQGLLIIVNDGDYIFTPEVMCHLLSRSMRSNFSSINSVIYFSANESVTAPTIQTPSLFWVDALLPSRTPVPIELREKLKNAWVAHHSLISTESFYEIEGQSEDISKIKFASSKNSKPI
jgi:hypothetical protein